MKNNKSMLIRLLTLMLAVMLCLSGMVVAQAASININEQPADQTVAEGMTATFSVAATGYSKVTWRVCSNNGSIDLSLGEMLKRFPGVTYEGGYKKTFLLHHVTAEMNGWKVYARLSRGKNHVDSEKAEIRIEGMEQPQDTDSDESPADDTTDDMLIPVEDEDRESVATDTDMDDDEDGAATTVDSEKVITAVGCTITYGKQAGLTSLNFADKNSVTVKIVCKGTPSYWVINGTRYDFKPVPKTITIASLERPLTIEAVKRGQKSTTLVSEEDILAQRTGQTLKVSTGTGVNLAFLNKSGKTAGGWFSSFDFTQDFKNKATKKEEQGGRITVHVRASLPEGKGVSGFNFMGAQWTFSTNVVQFTVRNLR